MRLSNTNGERWIICGGRQFFEDDLFSRTMVRVVEFAGGYPSLIIKGGATGADELAKQWANFHGIDALEIKADWNRGPFAGLIRNQQMIELKPDRVVAFPGGNGTDDMKRRAKANGIELITMTWESDGNETIKSE